MGKRGFLVLPVYAAIGLLIAAILVLAIINIGRAAGLDTTLERNYAARDIALLLDTVYASPGDLEYFYVMPERFDVTIKDNIVTVQAPQTKFVSSYYFASSGAFTEQQFQSDTPPTALSISKKGGTILIKGVYDEYEKEAISSFQDFIQFIKGNKDRHYDFACREEFEFNLNNGYYVVVDRNGEASLFYESGAKSTELARDKAAEFGQYTTGSKTDFFISSKNWKPGIAIRNSFTDKVIIVNDEKTKTWQWAQQTIKINNELPICEAQELARRHR